MNIIQAESAGELQETKSLFREYEQELAVDLCFQHFEEELAGLPGKYQPPAGALLLGLHDRSAVGCVAMRRMGSSTCEMKRLFVRPRFRKMGLGRLLAQEIISCAHYAGYRMMYLDTLARLKDAIQLYHSLGFRETAPYYDNPLDDVVYLQLELNR